MTLIDWRDGEVPCARIYDSSGREFPDLETLNTKTGEAMMLVRDGLALAHDGAGVLVRQRIWLSLPVRVDYGQA